MIYKVRVYSIDKIKEENCGLGVKAKVFNAELHLGESLTAL
jgi:hypothetical protein